jgi:hypothetical protein
MLITLSGPLVKGAVLAFWIKVRLNFEDGFYPLSTLEKLLNYYVPQICVWFFGDFWTYALDQGRKHCENFRIVSPYSTCPLAPDADFEACQHSKNLCPQARLFPAWDSSK